MMYPGRGGETCGRRGFTLIELLVAVVILAVGLTGVVGLSVSALSDLADASATSAALRTSIGIADSLLATASPTAGVQILRGGTLRWRPVGRSTSDGVWVDFEYRLGGPEGGRQSRRWRSVGTFFVPGP